MMWLEDYLVLGKAAPDNSKHYGHSICSAGYSIKRSKFFRIYPCSIAMGKKLKRWNIVKIPIERSKNDYRVESWCLSSREDRKEVIKNLTVVREFSRDRKVRRNFIHSLKSNCPSVFDGKINSLGIIKVKQIKKCFFKPRNRYSPNVQMKLTGGFVKTKKNYPYIPYVTFKCENCDIKGFHETQILEWGAYRFMDRVKHDPVRINELWEKYRLNLDERDVYFFMGNNFLHLKSFMVISILSFPKVESEKKIQKLDKYFQKGIP
ncbi:MAG: hypothetical protein ACTSPV_11930 [Candidatus Hodarchaeales archaeon]